VANLANLTTGCPRFCPGQILEKKQIQLDRLCDLRQADLENYKENHFWSKFAEDQGHPKGHSIALCTDYRWESWASSLSSFANTNS
jgi:hypothetical protein